MKNMRRAIMCCAGIALASVFLLTSCARQEMGTLETKESGENQPEKTDLTLMIDETTVSYYGDMIEELELEFPEYRIHSIDWSLPEVEKTVKTAMTRDESIEVVKWFPNQMENFISSHAAMDLSPYMDGEYLGGLGTRYRYV